MAINDYPVGPCPQCCRGNNCRCGADFWKNTPCEGEPVDINCDTKFCCVIEFDYSKLPGGGLQPYGGPWNGTFGYCLEPEKKLPTKVTFPVYCYHDSGSTISKQRYFTSGEISPCYPNYNTMNPGREPPNKHNLCFNLDFTAGEFASTNNLNVQLPVELGVWGIGGVGKFSVKSCSPLVVEAVMDDDGYNCLYDPNQQEALLPTGYVQALTVVGYYPGGHYADNLVPCSLVGLGLHPYNCNTILRPYLYPRVKTTITIKQWDASCVDGFEYNGKVARWWCTPAGCVQSVDPPQDKTAGPFNTKADCNEGCGTATASKWWCVNGSCVKSETAPTGATAGPFNTLAECEGGCSPPTPDPFWCVGGSCIQSATQPAGATGGPFQTLEGCLAGCAPPPENKWWCIYGILVQGVSSPHPDATGPFNSTTEASCGPAEMVWHCGETGPAKISRWEAVQRGFPYWATEQEVIDAGCVLKWYCAPGGCGSFTAPPSDSSSGPYNTEADCQMFCQSGAVKYWCVSQPGGGLNQCVQSISPPAGTVSGPYNTSGQCFENCNLVLDPAPVVARSSSISSAQIQRVTIPCIHLGENLEDPATCGCGTAVLRSCAVHGRCRKTGYPKAGESICLTCPDYQAPTS